MVDAPLSVLPSDKRPSSPPRSLYFWGVSVIHEARLMTLKVEPLKKEDTHKEGLTHKPLDPRFEAPQNHGEDEA